MLHNDAPTDKSVCFSCARLLFQCAGGYVDGAEEGQYICEECATFIAKVPDGQLRKVMEAALTQKAPANPLYVERNRTRVTIDFEGLLTLREVYERLASLETLTDNLVNIDYRKQEDYC